MFNRQYHHIFIYKGNVLERFAEEPREEFKPGDLYVSFEDIVYAIVEKTQLIDTIKDSIYKIYTLEKMPCEEDANELLVLIGARSN